MGWIFILSTLGSPNKGWHYFALMAAICTPAMNRNSWSICNQHLLWPISLPWKSFIREACASISNQTPIGCQEYMVLSSMFFHCWWVSFYIIYLLVQSFRYQSFSVVEGFWMYSKFSVNVGIALYVPFGNCIRLHWGALIIFWNSFVAIPPTWRKVRKLKLVGH